MSSSIANALSLLKQTFAFIKGTFADALRLAHFPRAGLQSIYSVSLYRNAGYLMINTGVGTILGFLFWIMVTRLYSPKDVGLGSALLSAVALLSFIGTLGLGFGIVRFLPKSDDKARFLNFSFTISFLASLIVALIFLTGLPFWSPELIFVRESPIFFVAFIVFIATATLSQILTCVFVAFRRASFTLAHGIIANLIRLALVAGFASFFKVFGIFASWGIATAVAFAVCLLVFLPQLFPYRPSPCFQRRASNQFLHFSFANYIGSVLNSLPALILPLMTLNILGAEQNAYLYITWTMASLLLVVSWATSFSLFAEASYTEERLGTEIRRSLKSTTLLLLPAVLIVAVLGDKLLLAFGKEYSAHGVSLLRLLALAALPASINSLYVSVVQVERRLKHIILVSGAIAFGVLILSYILLSHLGILGVGVGWLAAQTAVALIIAPRLVKRLK